MEFSRFILEYLKQYACSSGDSGLTRCSILSGPMVAALSFLTVSSIRSSSPIVSSHSLISDDLCLNDGFVNPPNKQSSKQSPDINIQSVNKCRRAECVGSIETRELKIGSASNKQWKCARSSILEQDLWIVQLLESNLSPLSAQPGCLIAVNLAPVPSPQLPPTI